MNKNKEHMDRMAILTQWYKKHKDKIINLKIFFTNKESNKERITRELNSKMLTIEQHPSSPGIFRILFENYEKGSDTVHEFIVFGYETSDVVEEKNKLIVYAEHYYETTRAVLTAK